MSTMQQNDETTVVSPSTMGRDTIGLPGHIVIRDTVGRPLDTDTTYQRAINRARRKVARGEPPHWPTEWQLPHAPLPARPDFSRNAPPAATDRMIKKQKKKSKKKLHDSLPNLVDTVEWDSKRDFNRFSVGLQQLETLPPLAAAALLYSDWKALQNQKIYMPFIGAPPTDNRYVPETERRDNAYVFPGFCNGCQKAGLCYGCEKDPRPHYHEMKTARMGGGFTFLKKDVPLGQIPTKNPINWKTQDDDVLPYIFYEGLQWPDLKKYGITVKVSKARLQKNHRVVEEEEEEVEPEQGKRGLKQRYDSVRLPAEAGVHVQLPGETGVQVQFPGEAGVHAPPLAQQDVYRIKHTSTPTSDEDSGRGATLADSQELPTYGSEISESTYTDTEIGGPTAHGIKLPALTEEKSGDLRILEKEGQKPEEKEKRKLYVPPPAFVLKKVERQTTIAESPFSTNRSYNIPKGTAFSIDKSDKEVTKFIEIERGDSGWKEPEKFVPKKRKNKKVTTRQPVTSKKKPGKAVKKERPESPPPSKAPKQKSPPQPVEIPPAPTETPDKRTPSPRPMSPDSGHESVPPPEAIDSPVDDAEEEILQDEDWEEESDQEISVQITERKIDSPDLEVPSKEIEEDTELIVENIEDEPVDRLEEDLTEIVDEKMSKESQTSMHEDAISESNAASEIDLRVEESVKDSEDEHMEPEDSVLSPGKTGPSHEASKKKKKPSKVTKTTKKPPLKKHKKVVEKKPEPEPEESPENSEYETGSEEEEDELLFGPTPEPLYLPYETTPPPSAPPPKRNQPPPLPRAAPPSPAALPEYKEPEKIKRELSKSAIEAPPPMHEPPKQRPPPPAIKPRRKVRARRPLLRKRHGQDGKEAVKTESRMKGGDPLDYLAKYCIIHPDRLPHYERVFNRVVTKQPYRYGELKAQQEAHLAEGQGLQNQTNQQTTNDPLNASPPKSLLSENEKRMIEDLQLISTAVDKEQAIPGMGEGDQMVSKIKYTLDVLMDKYETLQEQTDDLQEERIEVLANLARRQFPEITDPKYVPKAKKKKKKKKKDAGGQVMFPSGQNEAGVQTDISTTAPPGRHRLTDLDIVDRLDNKMIDTLSEDPRIAKLNVAIERLEEKLQDVDNRIEYLEDEKHFLEIYSQEDHQHKQTTNAKPAKFMRQQSSLYRKMHPSQDVEMNLAEVEEALRIINGNLLTEKELQYIFHVLDIPEKRRINLQMFSVVAALSEKVVQVDPLIRKLINKTDFEALDVKMEKCKELFYLLSQEEEDIPDGKVAASSLAVELEAGGVTPEHTKYVVDKFDREQKGIVDFLDFLTYVPLFIELHGRIVEDPLCDIRDL